MPELIGFIILLVILASSITGALGAWVAGEKGLSISRGLILGIVLSVLGVLVLAFMQRTDEVVVQEMYDRNMMDLKEYEKTMEVTLKK